MGHSVDVAIETFAHFLAQQATGQALRGDDAGTETRLFVILVVDLKGILDVEMNAGQMVEDIRLGVNGKTPVEFYGRMGGVVPTPEEILEHFEKIFIGGLK